MTFQPSSLAQFSLSAEVSYVLRASSSPPPLGDPSSPVGHSSSRESSDSSSSSSSSSSSFTTDPASVGVAEAPPQVEVVRKDAPTNAVDQSGSPLMVIPLEDLSWVDPRVMDISSAYGTEESVAKVFLKQPVLKAEEYSSHFSILPCGAAERVCMGRPGFGPPFFYMYTCFFVDLFVSLPFDEFTMGVIQTFNVAPTQVHPNTWASLQAFRLLCDVMRLHPTPSCFLSYYNSHPAKKAAWHSLAGRPGSVLFDLFALSYKRFKERFVKLVIRPEATSFFFIRPVGLGSPFIGLGGLVIIRSGRGRRRVRTSWMSLPFLTPSRGGFRAES